MTNAGFLERYQMLQQVGDGPVRSFHAMAGTGVVVMLHFLEGSEEANHALLALVDRLKPNERKRVLDVTAVDGKPVIVTRFISKDTIEERIDKVLREKRELFEAILGSDGDHDGLAGKMSVSLNASEIFGLFDLKQRGKKGPKSIGPKPLDKAA